MTTRPQECADPAYDGCSEDDASILIRVKRWQVVASACGCALAAAYPSPAIAVVPTLTKSKALGNAQAAISNIGNDSRDHRPRCTRAGRLLFNCTVRWADSDGDYRWNLRISIVRLAPDVSPVDQYRVTGRGLAAPELPQLKNVRVDERGRIFVDTRRARLGQTLRLFGLRFVDPTDVAVNPSPFVDPFLSDNEFEQPAPGSRYVASSVLVTNVGSRRADSTLVSSKLITTSNDTIDSASLSNCNTSIDIPPSEQRRLCVAFEVPYGVSVRQLEWGPGNEETGTWRP